MSAEESPAAAPVPVGAADFEELMAVVGPFEAAVELAVAVSGGADSLALAVLADEWARHRGGRIVALTVDHGLRLEAAEEARQVGRWLRRLGIPHHILHWRGRKPKANLQAAARAARYELLTRWCGEGRILHLLLAHHLDDQAETFLLRLGRGSGVDGLAAMAPVVETPTVRLVRPLLEVPRVRLAATLEARGQEWIKDPSNRDPAYARVRVRALLPRLAREGMTPTRLASTARHLGRARAALEAQTTRLLARAVAVFPAGYCRVDGAGLAAAPEEISLRALARALMCIGGRTYTPRLERLERLHRALGSGSLSVARTLAGCRITPHRGGVLICREPAAAKDRLSVAPGARIVWDHRFLIDIAAAKGGAGTPQATLERLGRHGWAEVAAADPSLRGTVIPAAVRPSLPALKDHDGVLAVPHLGYRRRGTDVGTLSIREIRFYPGQPLAGTRFAVV